jgi:hypothetical protein
MNIWRRGPLTENPYVRPAFRVVKAPREAMRRPTLARLIQQAKQVASSTPSARSIKGRPVTPEEVNAAEAILLKPELRILEELLMHSTEVPSVKRLRELSRKATEAIRGSAAQSPSPDTQALGHLMKDFMIHHIDHTTPADPLFGAAELNPPPPFGSQER